MVPAIGPRARPRPGSAGWGRGLQPAVAPPTSSTFKGTELTHANSAASVARVCVCVCVRVECVSYDHFSTIC